MTEGKPKKVELKLIGNENEETKDRYRPVGVEIIPDNDNKKFIAKVVYEFDNGIIDPIIAEGKTEQESMQNVDKRLKENYPGISRKGEDEESSPDEPKRYGY